ncbi:MAG: ABC transporter permease [Actinomycetota bacterium]|nr:ABC transporter permease [Actinomycetota bacterium]
MELLANVLRWFASAEAWAGSGIEPGIIVRLYEHMTMSFQSVGLAALLVLPLGLYVGHTSRFGAAVVSIGNLARALPSFGILGIFFALLIDVPGTLGFWPTFVALVFLAIPPILTNTYIGINGVDVDTVESARAMGMTERQILLQIELRLGAPLIVAGLRLAAVQVVATATLGAVAAWGGLGRYIVDGFAAGDDVQLVAGAILVAAVAVVTELSFGLLERVATPHSASDRTKPARGSTRMLPREN